MEFEKLKKIYFPTDRPIPEKQCRVRGNKNIFKVGLMSVTLVVYCLGSITPPVPMSKIATLSLGLVSVTEEACSSYTWPEISETVFSW